FNLAFGSFRGIERHDFVLHGKSRRDVECLLLVFNSASLSAFRPRVAAEWRSPLKVVAFMPVYNEADILPFVLAHMREQGIDVHVLDNWSTDGTFEILMRTPGITVERFPASGPSDEFSSRDLQARVEELALHSDADWCMLSDADEWRRSSRDGERLVDAIARVDAEGFNCIDHQVFNFFCTDENWSGNPEEYFQ